MRITDLHLLLLLLLSFGVQVFRCQPGSDSQDCEVCDLEKRLGKCESDLQGCLGRTHEETQCVNDDTYLNRISTWIGAGSPRHDKAVSTLRKTLHNFLIQTQLDQRAKMTPDVDVIEVQATIAISRKDLDKLKLYLLVDHGKDDDIQDILGNCIKVEEMSSLRITMEKFKQFIEHEWFIIVQVAAASLWLIYSLCTGVAVWKVAVVLIVGSVAWTWVHLYKIALSRKQATLRRLGDVPKMCLIEKQGWTSAIKDAVYGFVGIKENKCEDYYEALMVDPFWEVTPLKALSETLSQFVLRPLELLGSSLGVFFNDVITPLPFVWKIPVLLIVTAILLLILIMACRYKIHTPLLVKLEPSSKPNSESRQEIKHNSPEQLPYPTTRTMLDNLVDPCQQSII